MKLGAVLNNSFFIYHNEIKYKQSQIKKSSLCYPISFNLLNSSIGENLYNLNNGQKINNNEEVKLWNITNYQLDFYFSNQRFWFLHDEQTMIFYNFTLFHSQYPSLSNFLAKISKENEDFFYRGKIKLNVNNGLINEKSITFFPNNNLMKVSRINGILFKELSSFDDMTFDRHCLLNIIFNQNPFFRYIDEINNKYLKNQDGITYDIKGTLKIIKFCVLQSDFYNCLINIRSIRNLIFSYIYDEIFIPVYCQLEKITQEISLNQSRLNAKWTTQEEVELIKEKLKNYQLQLNQIIVWYKQFKKIDQDLPDEKIIARIFKEKKDYCKEPIYFSNLTFKGLNNTKFPKLKIDDKKVIRYIKEKILSEKEKNIFRKANLLTNNAVHKNNYQRINNQYWYLKSNELNILLETLKIYFDILIKFQENHQLYRQEVLSLFNSELL